MSTMHVLMLPGSAGAYVCCMYVLMGALQRSKRMTGACSNCNVVYNVCCVDCVHFSGSAMYYWLCTECEKHVFESGTFVCGGVLFVR